MSDVLIMFRADHSYNWVLDGKRQLTQTGAEALSLMADLHDTSRRYGPNDPMVWVDLGMTFPACPIR